MNDNNNDGSIVGNDNRKNEVAKRLVHHQPSLRKAAFVLVRGTSLDAHDLIQCTNELVLQNWFQWKGFAFGKWVHTILLRAYLAEKEQRKRYRGIDLSDDGWCQVEDQRAAWQMEGAVENLDFVRALAKLSPEHREVLILISIEGYSYEEVAIKLGIPEGTVTSRLKRARRRYEQYLKAHHEETLVEVMA